MELKMCPTCKHPFLAEKQVCPNCPPQFVWNRKSWKHYIFLISVTILPLIFLLLLMLYLLTGTFSR